MINFFDHLRQSTQIVIGFVMIAGIAMLDYTTGVELSFSIFYFVPIILASWYINRSYGLSFALLCAIGWGVAEYLGEGEQLNLLVFVFNATVRLGIFITIAMLISRLRRDSDALLSERMRQHALLENFVSLVKHELRNSLSTGKLMLENLALERLTKKQLALIDNIGEENERVEDTISMLSLLANKDGVRGTDPEPIDLTELVRTMMEPLNKDGKVTLRCNATRAYPINCQKSIVVHVIDNILSNAIKYSRDGSSVEIGLKGDTEGIIFSCADAGIGIPHEEQRRLFDPFFRASNTQHVRGTGVGLYVAKELLERIGGRIEVRSVIGEGTKVEVLFPHSL